MKNLFLILAGFAIISISGCQKEDNPINGEGTITGTVYAANGTTPVIGARVEVIGYENQYNTLTNNVGYFMLKCPAGHQRIRITKGSGDIFNSVVDVSVDNETTIEMPTNQTILLQEGNLAYIGGEYDSIQNIIIDSLGYNAVQLDTNDLLNLTLMQSFDVIFLNCGYKPVFDIDTAKHNNLEKYLLNGGNLYASDFAMGYVADLCDSNNLGGFISSTLVCWNPIGNPGMEVGSVISPDLQAIFGHSININYNLPSWAQLTVDVLDPRVDVLIDHSTLGPLLVDIQWKNTPGGGKITYTTFHNEANVNSQMVDALEWIIFNF